MTTTPVKTLDDEIEELHKDAYYGFKMVEYHRRLRQFAVGDYLNQLVHPYCYNKTDSSSGPTPNLIHGSNQPMIVRIERQDADGNTYGRVFDLPSRRDPLRPLPLAHLQTWIDGSREFQLDNNYVNSLITGQTFDPEEYMNEAQTHIKKIVDHNESISSPSVFTQDQPDPALTPQEVVTWVETNLTVGQTVWHNWYGDMLISRHNEFDRDNKYVITKLVTKRLTTKQKKDLKVSHDINIHIKGPHGCNIISAATSLFNGGDRFFIQEPMYFDQE